MGRKFQRDGKELTLADRGLPSDENGFIALTPELIERMTDVLIEENGNLTKMLDKVGINKATFWVTWRSSEAIESIKDLGSELALRSYEDILDSVIHNPEAYDKALSRPSWMNAIMFRTKKLDNSYRDSNSTQVNTQINISDLDGFKKQFFETKTDP